MKRITDFRTYIIERCSTVGDCWIWQGTTDRLGYARCNVQGWRFAHRLAYTAWHGEIPKELSIDHLCRNRACCNPEHLEAVTHRENVLRGESPIAKQARQTHCKRGHEFTSENTIITASGSRRCRTCNAVHQAAYRDRLRAATVE